MVNFLKTTVLGGVLFLVPLVFVVFIVDKGVDLLRKVSVPIHAMLPNGGFFGVNLILLLFLIIFCFVAGLIARHSKIAGRVRRLDDFLIRNLPGYFQIKGIVTGHLSEDESEALLIPVIVRDPAGSVRLGFEVERDDHGRAVVFFPASPNPQTGFSTALPVSRVEKVDVPFREAMEIFQFSGRGLAELIARHEQSKDQTPD